ncbi:zinc-containing alcohol [Moniliophthora roreri]|nr:zinc-containing alcohol [Moniliophthora roreri]
MGGMASGMHILDEEHSFANHSKSKIDAYTQGEQVRVVGESAGTGKYGHRLNFGERYIAFPTLPVPGYVMFSLPVSDLYVEMLCLAHEMTPRRSSIRHFVRGNVERTTLLRRFPEPESSTYYSKN